MSSERLYVYRLCTRSMAVQLAHGVGGQRAVFITPSVSFTERREIDVKKRERKSYSKDIVKYHLRYERQMLLIAWGMMLAFYWFLHFSVPTPYPPDVTLLRLLCSAASFFLLRTLCGSRLTLRFSNVGKELQKYGNIQDVAKDVNGQYQAAIYRSVDQAITERYIILLVNNENYVPLMGAEGSGSAPTRPNMRSIFERECCMCLISTSELDHVELEGNNPYADDRNVLCFVTKEGKTYSIILYREYGQARLIKEQLEECVNLRKGPFSHNSDKKIYQERKEALKKSKSLSWNESGHTVSTCLAGRRKIFRGIMLAIVVLLIGVFAFLAEMEDYTLSQYMWDIVHFPVESIVLATVYIVPPTLIYIHIRRMERQTLRQYRRLKYYEQQALDERIRREPELRAGDVLYEPSCLWFRDWHNLLFQNLVLYEDVVWIYPANAASDLSVSSAPGISGVMFWHAVIFYTRDGRKHSIFMGDYGQFAAHFPHTLAGYGREQKRAYKEIRRRCSIDKNKPEEL